MDDRRRLLIVTYGFTFDLTTECSQHCMMSSCGLCSSAGFLSELSLATIKCLICYQVNALKFINCSQQKDKEDFTFLRKDHARTSLIYAAFQDCRSWSLIGHSMMSRFRVELPKFYSLMLSSWGLIGKTVSVILLVRISTLTSCESLQL